MSLVKGTHFATPLLGSDRYRKGLYRDVPLAHADQIRSPYAIYVEDFNDAFVDGGLAGCGWTLTDINTATSPTEVVDPETGYLLLNPGTKDDSGSQIQKILLPSQGTYVAPAHKVLGPITSTATLMDGREIFWEARIGPMVATGTAWDGKALIGWYTTDTSLLATAGGLPTVAAGGGFGFHIGEDGILSYHCSPDAITAAGTATSTDFSTLTTAATPEWTTVGARMRVVDASASTGVADFFVNGSKIGTITNTTCMDSTEEFAFSIAILNGDNSIAHDLAVDWIVTGITRPGLTYPYSSGTY